MKNYYYTTTNYPKIYESCYWGHFDCESEMPPSEIIENRNSFIHDNNIKEHCWFACTSEFSKHQYNFDHLEIYRSHDGRIFVICSPYDKDRQNTDPLYQYPVKVGFKVYRDLYHESATTYIISFENYKELQHFCRNLSDSCGEWTK